MVHKLNVEDITPVGTSRLRCVLSQVIACMSPNFLLLDIGMAISFATIALPDLLNSDNDLFLTETQASWFGSLSYLTQPLGAIVSGPIVDYFGRKKANFLVNIPHLIAWTLLYYAWNVPSLFIANALLGLGTGIMEAPINSYVGEISEPSTRGALCTLTQLFTSIGVFVMYFLGTVTTWRVAALSCLVAPLGSMILCLLVPETPVWLLSRGKEKDALKALCYLRGWTTADQVREEYDALRDYTRKLELCVICTSTQETQECPHNEMNMFKRWLLRFRYIMLCKETLRPWTLIIMYFTFYVMSGLTPIRPNMVNVCSAFGMADDGKNIVLMVGMITLLMSVLVVGLIKIVGKRKLAITALLSTAISSMALSIYARHNLDDSVFTYDVTTFPTETSYVPLVLFYLMAVFTGLGIPWVLLGEVFPFQSRALAQGFAAAGNYVIMFIGSKTFINLESALQLWGTFAVYAAFGFIGTVYLYFFLPETEGKTLQEIESYYNGELRTFADDPVINYFKRFKKKV
ncbi:facilitated trehalose transporter Tret1-like [Pectinophora gossypiella]|uniref:facilitated trehalose transporter Tret1-like n=1 Tax=Pectinophora gossypiella TaxID=13191 RepID=UPI00214EBB36|nr:facilitated trehalose transporter Tret1-like [Pectinophora gossypiella]